MSSDTDTYNVYIPRDDHDMDVSAQVDCVAEVYGAYGAYTSHNLVLNDTQQQQQRNTNDGENTSGNTGVVDSWNERFQASLSMPESNDEETYLKFVRLTHLSLDFIEVAKMYGATIITEHFSNQSDRSVPAKDLGGILGGTKFVVGGILFKLASDTLNGDTYLFGGAKPNTEFANKGAGHELRGAISYFQFHSMGLCVPMQALVDYRGFRLVAMPLLPISGSSSIIYGSGDKGVTIHLDDSFCEMMKSAAKQLHVAAHFVSASPSKRIFSAGDVEGHIGTDGRRYLLDLSRTCPPEGRNDVVHLPAHPQGVFFRLLRPELMKLRRRLRLPPLSPDAYSGWSSKCKDSQDHMVLVEAATQHMLTEQVNAVVDELVSMNPVEIRQRLFQYSLSTVTHKHGVNVRHMGLIRHRILNSAKSRGSAPAAEVLLVELVARTVKNLLRATCRQEMRAQQGHAYASDFLYRAKIVFFLNMISYAGGSVSREFWKERMPKALSDRFGSIALTDDETKEGVFFRLFGDTAGSLLGSVNRGPMYLKHVVLYALRAVGMELTSSCLTSFTTRPSGFEFVTADLAADAPLVKFMPIIDVAEGMVILEQAKAIADKTDTEHVQQLGVLQRLLSLASSKFAAASIRDMSALVRHIGTVTSLRSQAYTHEFHERHNECDSELLKALQYALKQQSTVGAYQSIVLRDNLDARMKVLRTILLDIFWLWIGRTQGDLLKFGGASTRENVRKVMEAMRVYDKTDEVVQKKFAEFLARVPYEMGGDCFRSGILWLTRHGKVTSENFTISTNNARVTYIDPSGRNDPKVFTDFDWLYTTNSDGQDDDREDVDAFPSVSKFHNDLRAFQEPPLTSHNDATVAVFGGPYEMHRQVLSAALQRRAEHLFNEEELAKNQSSVVIRFAMFEITPANHIVSYVDPSQDKRNKNAVVDFRPKKTEIKTVVFSKIPRVDVTSVKDIEMRVADGWSRFLEGKKGDVRLAEDSHMIIEVSVHRKAQSAATKSDVAPRRRVQRKVRAVKKPASTKQSKSALDGGVVTRMVSLARYRREPSINKALSNVVTCLHARRAKKVIPVRNSLLTRLMRKCLSSESGGKLTMLSVLDDEDSDEYNLFRLKFLSACLGDEDASFL